MFNVTFTIGHTGAHKPTIYEVLKTKLRREPTDAPMRARPNGSNRNLTARPSPRDL
jgi:hypothetical protein